MSKPGLTVKVLCSLCILIQAFAATCYPVYDEESNDFGAAKEGLIYYNDEELEYADLNQENAPHDNNDNEEVKGEGNFDDEVDGEHIDDEDYDEELKEDDPDR